MAYPRSFLGLLIGAFTLVALPLVGALAYAAWHTERLVQESRAAVFSASQAARASRTLVSRIGSIERLALQMAALEDPRLAEDLSRAHGGFQKVAEDLLQLPLGAAQRAALDRTMAHEAALRSTLLEKRPGPADLASVRQLTGDLAEHAHEVLVLSDDVADRAVAALRGDAELVQRQLMLLVLFGTAAALTIALALSRYIARPIRALDAAIRQLGAAEFAAEIRVRGPEDLQSLGQRLDWLRRRLAELEAEKNRFMRHLSHELKTPLTALREGTELLHDGVAGPLAVPQRQVVDIMRDNGVKLTRLIEDLLDYQRAVHAAATLTPCPIDLDSLVLEVARSHELAMQAKGQRLELDLVHLGIEADPEKLRSIVDNLVGNAVKFTPEGGVIAVSVAPAGDEAVIEVRDSGPGVPPEERDAVFESFFRGRNRASGRIPGSGLGLAIAREYAEAHGGRIRLVGDEGRGARFRVTLPRRASPKLARAA